MPFGCRSSHTYPMFVELLPSDQSREHRYLFGSDLAPFQPMRALAFCRVDLHWLAREGKFWPRTSFVKIPIGVNPKPDDRCLLLYQQSDQMDQDGVLQAC